MKIISIGTDRKLFEASSSVRQRQIEYGKFFEEVHIIVFSTRKSETNSKIEISKNIWVYPTNSINRKYYLWDAFKIAKKIIKAGDNRDFIVTTQDPFETGLAGAFIKLFFNLPLHIQVHTDFMDKYFWQSSAFNKIRFMMAEFIIKYSDRVRVVSERIKKSVEEFSKAIDVLPIKAEIKQITEGDIRKPFPFTVLMVCRFEKEKNIETVLHAVKNLDDRNIGLCLVGDGSERENLKKLVHDLDISERVIFTGWINDLAPYYKIADAFISASFYEGYGVSTVEAAYFEKPLILSDTGVAREIFNESSSFICDAKDSACFIESIFKIYEDRNLAQMMGRSAKEAADRHLNSKENYFRQYAESVSKAAEDFKKKNFISRFFEFGKIIFDSFIALRYFLCGITAAAVNIISLYIFTDISGIWYLYSSILAFVLSLLISFALQKFVTFKDKKTDGIRHQFSKFSIVAVLGIITNTALVFVCVHWLGIYYIFAQIIGGIFVMVQNFLFYKMFIFKKR